MQTVLQAYEARIAEGELEPDPRQVVLARRLDALGTELAENRIPPKSSALGWLLSRNRRQNAPKGLYIWGSVGRGKSMLMDLFYSIVSHEPKRRVHFHAFMADAQNRIHEQRQLFKEGKSKEEDPIPPVARALAREARLLCFDEFAVNDIADAMILGRLFTGLFEAGVTVVATSNVAPDDLYKNGLNRQLFLPFVDLLKTQCEVFELDSSTDYRLEKIADAPVYIAPLGERTDHAVEDIWRAWTAGAGSVEETVTVKGRKVTIQKASAGMARFRFSDLCEKPLGAADYLAIAKQYHTIFIEHVPIMELAQRQYAKRFINLVDALYDNRNRIVVSAAANPHALYQPETGVEAFEFQRTASRLIEMQSREWLDAFDRIQKA